MPELDLLKDELVEAEKSFLREIERISMSPDIAEKRHWLLTGKQIIAKRIIDYLNGNELSL